MVCIVVPAPVLKRENVWDVPATKKLHGAKFANAILLKESGVVLIVKSIRMLMIAPYSIILLQKLSGLCLIPTGERELLLLKKKVMKLMPRIWLP